MAFVCIHTFGTKQFSSSFMQNVRGSLAAALAASLSMKAGRCALPTQGFPLTHVEGKGRSQNRAKCNLLGSLKWIDFDNSGPGWSEYLWCTCVRLNVLCGWIRWLVKIATLHRIHRDWWNLHSFLWMRLVWLHGCRLGKNLPRTACLTHFTRSVI